MNGRMGTKPFEITRGPLIWKNRKPKALMLTAFRRWSEAKSLMFHKIQCALCNLGGGANAEDLLIVILCSSSLVSRLESPTLSPASKIQKRDQRWKVLTMRRPTSFKMATSSRPAPSVSSPEILNQVSSSGDGASDIREASFQSIMQCAILTSARSWLIHLL